jgi:hypothetical protein
VTVYHNLMMIIYNRKKDHFSTQKHYRFREADMSRSIFRQLTQQVEHVFPVRHNQSLNCLLCDFRTANGDPFVQVKAISSTIVRFPNKDHMVTPYIH